MKARFGPAGWTTKNNKITRMKMKKINMATLTVAAICLSPMIALAEGGGIPTPVPEPATILAGAACLIPIGVGIVRSIRKNRR